MLPAPEGDSASTSSGCSLPISMLVTGMRVGGADLSGQERTLLACDATIRDPGTGSTKCGQAGELDDRELGLVAGRLCTRGKPGTSGLSNCP